MCVRRGCTNLTGRNVMRRFIDPAMGRPDEPRGITHAFGSLLPYLAGRCFSVLIIRTTGANVGLRSFLIAACKTFCVRMMRCSYVNDGFMLRPG